MRFFSFAVFQRKKKIKNVPHDIGHFSHENEDGAATIEKRKKSGCGQVNEYREEQRGLGVEKAPRYYSPFFFSQFSFYESIWFLRSVRERHKACLPSTGFNSQ